MECPCCGAEDLDESEMAWLSGRGSDYSRRVCSYCYDSAIDGDRRVWAFYWHDCPETEDDGWRPFYDDSAVTDSKLSGPSRRWVRPISSGEEPSVSQPGSAAESFAELVARNEQLRAFANTAPTQPGLESRVVRRLAVKMARIGRRLKRRYWGA